MEIALLSGNVDAISCQDIEVTGKTEATSTYLKTLKIEKTLIPTEARYQDYSYSVLKTVKPLTKPIELEKLATSVATLRNYLPLALASQQYEISKDAEDFINKQKKAVQYRKDILTISDKASEFLRKKGIGAKISIDLFTDPEYSDWVESKIRIEVSKNEFKKAYDTYSKLLSYSLKGIQKKTLKKLFVTIESR